MSDSLGALATLLRGPGLTDLAKPAAEPGFPNAISKPANQAVEVHISDEARAARSNPPVIGKGPDVIAEILEIGLLKYIRQKQEERMREEVLAELGLSEEDIAKMSSEQRGKIEEKIQEMIREKIMAQMEERLERQLTKAIGLDR